MFTGLIEAVGEVGEVKPTPAGFRLRITSTLADERAPGASLAVNGVCLTVIAADADGIHMDVSPETVRVTSLGGLKRGSLVNLERPVRADARMGGHFVQGHVDAPIQPNSLYVMRGYLARDHLSVVSVYVYLVRKGS